MENIGLEKTQKDANSKFCKHCGGIIPKEAVICIKCGCQVEEMKSSTQPQVVINNSNSNVNTNNNNMNAGFPYRRDKNKWVAFLLCLFLGYLGIHKFYEGKIVMGIIYFCTGGLFAIGWIIDCIVLLCKPNPYYVK